MEWLNYHHLLYFWTVVARRQRRARGRELRLAQPTVSGQVQRARGGPGREAVQPRGPSPGADRRRPRRLPLRRRDLLPRPGAPRHRQGPRRPAGPCGWSSASRTCSASVARTGCWQPALELADRSASSAGRTRAESLLADLALHELDVVLADAPRAAARPRAAPSTTCSASAGRRCFAAPARWRAGCAAGFPRSLTARRSCCPAGHRRLRRALEQWFEATGIRPRIVGEFDDSALMKAFGEQGAGRVRRRRRRSRTRSGGSTASASSAASTRSASASTPSPYERRIKHPAVVAIAEAARSGVLKAATLGLKRDGRFHPGQNRPRD